MPRLTALLAAVLAVAIQLAPTTATAEDFQLVTEESEFRALISGKDLKRFAISLSVQPDGQITGKGYGRKVTGDWRWESGYFCRDLFWGKTDLGFNCQKVLRNGETLRFIENRGTGRYADLRLN